MKLLIPTHGRAGHLSTHLFLPDTMDWRVLVHDEASADAYATAQPELAQRIHVTDTPSGWPPGEQADPKLRQIAWALASVPAGEWVAMCDDDVTAVQCVPDSYRLYSTLPVATDKTVNWTQLYATPCHPTDFAHLCRQATYKAETVAAYGVGFSWSSNALFRATKWRNPVPLMGGFAIVKNDPQFPWDRATAIGDLWLSAMHLARYGQLVRNDYVAVLSRFYAQGGLGQRSPERVHRLHDGLVAIERDFPGLFRRVANKHSDFGWDLRLATRGLSGLHRWRMEHGWA